jgi:hypothetical protein
VSPSLVFSLIASGFEARTPRASAHALLESAA